MVIMKGGGEEEGGRGLFFIECWVSTVLRYHYNPMRKEWLGEAEPPAQGDVVT